MQQLYQARDRLEAQQLIDRLEQEQIKAVVLGDHLSGGAGELSAVNFPTVWVIENGQLLRAQGILGLFLSQQRDAAADIDAWVCPSCKERVGGEFALCWNCGEVRRDD